VSETFWFDDGAALLPQPIAALFNAVMEARHACAF
jgi:hypothetical protein